MQDWRLAVDIGGTFTDVVLLDAAGTTTVIEKVLTTPKEPAAGVMDGVRRALARAGVGARDVRYVIHGTTLVTNALIERKGAPTGLITTAGHGTRSRSAARRATTRTTSRSRSRSRWCRHRSGSASRPASWPTAASACRSPPPRWTRSSTADAPPASRRSP
jgi:hypothetical protein